jgi:hypothetical protein
MVSKVDVQNLLLSTSLSGENPYSLYIGINPDNLTLIVNSNDSIPYCRKITAREDKMLALDSDYTLSSEIYRFTIVNTELNLNNQFWLSSDNGNTFEKVNVMRKQSRFLSSYWWLFIEKQN